MYILGVMTKEKIRVFYDGSCGLCHYFIRFILLRMATPSVFRFSPLEGETFKKIRKDFPDFSLPDSVVVYDEKSDQLLVKTEAITTVLDFLRWPWKSIARLIKWILLRASNKVYDFVARKRRKLFKKPNGSCPSLRPEWKVFFED